MLSFEKWQATGNTFLFIENWEKNTSLSPEKIQRFCHPSFGVGADSVIFFEPSEKADCKMNYFNADGTQAETCGNGLRATFAFGKKYGFLKENIHTIENPNGRVDTVEKVGENYRVCLGAPSWKNTPDFPDNFLGEEIEEKKWWCISMGNPHAVSFVKDTENCNFEYLGKTLEKHSLFPHRINVEFVHPLSDTEANFRVWERGVQETLACGSGAAAATVAGTLAGKFAKNAEILLHLKGGDLLMLWDQEKNVVFKTGPAKEVFSGEIAL